MTADWSGYMERLGKALELVAGALPRDLLVAAQSRWPDPDTRRPRIGHVLDKILSRRRELARWLEEANIIRDADMLVDEWRATLDDNDQSC